MYSGTCGVGLKCLVRFNVPRNTDGRKQENEATGICVPEDSALCPGPDVLSLEEGVNCRPGRLGIISDALYCPELGAAKASTTPAPVQVPTGPPFPTRPPNAPSLVDLLLFKIPVPFANF